MAWAALDEGHAIFEERTRFEDGAWRMELQNPALEVPKNPFVYGHTGTVEAIAGGNAPDGRMAGGWRGIRYRSMLCIGPRRTGMPVCTLWMDDSP